MTSIVKGMALATLAGILGACGSCPCALPWEQLAYLSDGAGEIKVTCTEEGVVRDIDLSAHVGEALYGGVHTQPDRTTGSMSTVCFALKTW